MCKKSYGQNSQSLLSYHNDNKQFYFSCLILLHYYNTLFVLVALRPNAAYGLLVTRSFLITHNDAPQSVGLLCTSDKLVAGTST
jgi:hypothetical protein